MSHCFRCAATAAAALFLVGMQPAPAENIEVRLEPGRWRISTTTLTGGPPSPPQVAMRCLTPAEVDDPVKTFGPQVSTVNSQCESTEFRQDRAGLAWGVRCRGQMDMEVAGQFLFASPTRYSALIVTRATLLDSVRQQSMVSIAAERVGDCP